MRVRRFRLFFFGVCDVRQLVVVMCTLLFSMVTAVYTDPHGHMAFRLRHPASRWSQVWYVRRDNLVPSRRFREDGH